MILPFKKCLKKLRRERSSHGGGAREDEGGNTSAQHGAAMGER
jgi:hypothetical protein